ncbi:MAG: hypothetical protein UZ21_OP11001000293 [Microgenomates bacterium OLB22]|nr:MAG: hypothetical protein UZ21_OP11001000293 [Microgenomates bacterium OLB22]
MRNVNKIHFEKLAEFIRNRRFTPTQKVLFVDIILYAGINGDAFPSQQTLADDLSRTPRNIRYCLDMLCAAGLISKKRRGFSKSNQYLISKEIYFRNGDSNRNPIASHLSNPFPDRPGNALPPNVTQLNNSIKDLSEEEKEQIEKRKQEIRERYSFLKGSSRK